MVKKYIKKRKFFFGLLEEIPLIIFSFTIAFPLYFLVVNSFKSRTGYLVDKVGLPLDFTISNFIDVFSRGNFLRWAINSLLITSFSIFIGFFISILMSYGFSSFNFRRKSTFFSAAVSLMIIPPMVIVIPLYRFYFELNLLNNYFGIIMIYVAYIVPFWTYFLTKFFLTIPRSLKESAMIDGGSDIFILFKIILPLSKAPIVTLIMISTLFVWNDLLIPLIFMQEDNLRTLIPGIIIFRGRFQMNYPVVFAGMLTTSIPMFILFILAQRYFVKGILSGAIKG